MSSWVMCGNLPESSQPPGPWPSVTHPGNSSWEEAPPPVAQRGQSGIFDLCLNPAVATLSPDHSESA